MSPACSRARERRAIAVVALLAVAVALASPARAAGTLDERARTLLDEATRQVESALLSDVPRTPDHGGWREALALGRQALVRHDHPEVHRFLARTYTLVGWSVRALTHFHQLLDAGASLADDPPGVVPPDVGSLELYASAASDLGFARAQIGDLDGAAAVYQRWLEVMPDELEVVRRLGAVHLERGDPLAALPHWERLVEADPQDATARFYLGEARRAAAVGPGAATAFRDGVNAYEAGAFADALERFEAALAAAPDFADAAVWAGRSALELAQPGRAVAHWERAVRLRPDDAGAAYFLRVARDQSRYGITAARAFHAGLIDYERGEVRGALEAFERAVAANPDFGEAWVWLARLHQEQGRYDAAVTTWERVLQLDPEDERARYFLTLSRQQRTVGAAAGGAFAAGVAAYEAADFATAEARFREAAALDPSAVQVWVWLGRLYFTLARYADAAQAYGRAAALAPDDDDIAFFAAEAAALAAPPVREDAAPPVRIEPEHDQPGPPRDAPGGLPLDDPAGDDEAVDAHDDQDPEEPP